MAHLSLSLMGPLQITLAGEPITGFESDKVRALLAYLAVEAHQPHRRDSLAGLLWPDWPDRAARKNLRNGLANLRRALGDHHATPPFLLLVPTVRQSFPISFICSSGSACQPQDSWLPAPAY